MKTLVDRHTDLIGEVVEGHSMGKTGLEKAELRLTNVITISHKGTASVRVIGSLVPFPWTCVIKQRVIEHWCSTCHLAVQVFQCARCCRDKTDGSGCRRALIELFVDLPGGCGIDSCLCCAQNIGSLLHMCLCCLLGMTCGLHCHRCCNMEGSRVLHACEIDDEPKSSKDQQHCQYNQNYDGRCWEALRSSIIRHV